MVDVYYIQKLFNTDEIIKRVISRCYGVSGVQTERASSGKPYLAGCDLKISVTHTDGFFALAVSDDEVGVDCEKENRTPPSHAVIKRLTERERACIKSDEDYLRLWTAKESYVKYLGGTLASHLKHIEFFDGEIHFKNQKQEVKITHSQMGGYILCVCSTQCEINYIRLNNSLFLGDK